MNLSFRAMPMLAVIAVSALSGALASAVVERAASAATAPTAQDPQLTNLLKYVSVDSAGDVAIKGTQIQICGYTTVTVQASMVSVQGAGQTSIKGAIVTIN